MQLEMTYRVEAAKAEPRLHRYLNQVLKPLSVTTNVVGLQTDDADHAGQNSSAHVARVIGLQTDAVVVIEVRLSRLLILNYF